MSYVRVLVCVIVLHCMVVPEVGLAAGNPALDALAQGKIVQFSGKESISQPFTFEVTMVTTDKALNFSAVVGQPITMTVAPGRLVSGMIERVEQVDGSGAQGLYRLQIVPSANRLKYSRTSRTFYGRSATEIASLLLDEAGVRNVEMRISTPVPPLDVAIQYQESNFAFMSRLLERAGIHYHIEPSPSGDKIVFSDGNAGFPVSPAGKVLFSTNAVPAVFSFVRGQSVYSGFVQTSDYNWETPALDLSAVAQTTLFADLREGVFPGYVDTQVEAQAVANIRMGSHLTEAQSCSGESSYPQLQAGQRVVLSGHPRTDFNQEYVITAVEHQKTAKDYRNTFRCLPSQVVYRPQQTTPVPVVAGVVSAIVVGPGGETKFVDKFGRVKVRFPWRIPAKSSFTDPGDAGFVRVAQIAAGAGSAAMWLPEVGDEVLVAFEHGDLRRPVVIGSLYNAKDMPPVALPANKHLGILRNRAPNGQVTELVFDNTVGNEQVTIRSGPQSLRLAASGTALEGVAGITLQGAGITINSGSDLVERAVRDKVVDVGRDLSIKAGQNIIVSGQKDAAISVGGNTTFVGQKDATLSVGGNTQFNNGGALRAAVGGETQLSLGANLQLTVGGSTVFDNGKDLSVRAGQNLLLQSARAAKLTVGDDAVIQTGKSVIVNAGAMLQFVAAQTGTIDAKGGLFLKSPTHVEIDSTEVAVKSSGNLILKGSKITQN